MRRVAHALGMAGVLFLGACVILPRPTVEDATTAAQRWPGTTLEMLQEGRSIYAERCSTCHSAIHPQTILEDQWPGEVAKMKRRAHVGRADAEKIVRYILSVRRPGGGREPVSDD